TARRDRRLRVRRREVEDGSQAPAPARRAVGARPRDRTPPRRRVRAVRAAGGVSFPDALDPERAGRGAAPLQGRRLRVRRVAHARQLREEGPGRRDVDASVLIAAARAVRAAACILAIALIAPVGAAPGATITLPAAPLQPGQLAVLAIRTGAAVRSVTAEALG